MSWVQIPLSPNTKKGGPGPPHFFSLSGKTTGLAVIHVFCIPNQMFFMFHKLFPIWHARKKSTSPVCQTEWECTIWDLLLPGLGQSLWKALLGLPHLSPFFFSPGQGRGEKRKTEEKKTRQVGTCAENFPGNRQI